MTLGLTRHDITTAFAHRRHALRTRGHQSGGSPAYSRQQVSSPDPLKDDDDVRPVVCKPSVAWRRRPTTNDSVADTSKYGSTFGIAGGPRTPSNSEIVALYRPSYAEPRMTVFACPPPRRRRPSWATSDIAACVD
jgi:hypothetical protein